LDKNLNASAISRKPNETLTVLSQPPDLGISFSQDGNIAKSVKGIAKADENPSIPIAGPK
jgi:hypothetical protein